MSVTLYYRRHDEREEEMGRTIDSKVPERSTRRSLDFDVGALE